MTKQTISAFTLALISAAALACSAHAAEKKTGMAAPEKAAAPAAAKPAQEEAEKPGTFRGILSDANKSGKTITLANKKGTNQRTFTVSDSAKITKGRAAATWEDLAVGVKVHGTLQKTADGKMEVATLKVGRNPEEKAGKGTEKKPEAKPAEAKKE